MNDTKKCCRCKEIKPTSEFYKSRIRKDGLNTICKECHKEYTHRRNQRPDVKIKYLRRAYKHRDKKIAWFWSNVPNYCAKCKYDKSISALQFHHTLPSQKKSVDDTLSNWLRKLSFEHLKQKVKEHKFLILCANCHAELHAGEWTLDDIYYEEWEHCYALKVK